MKPSVALIMTMQRIAIASTVSPTAKEMIVAPTRRRTSKSLNSSRKAKMRDLFFGEGSSFNPNFASLSSTTDFESPFSAEVSRPATTSSKLWT